jgi:4-amino-4-deoxy-L-arabinose transferase-like glycosyltransferase
MLALRVDGLSSRQLILGVFLLTVIARLFCLGATFRRNQSVEYFEDVVIADNLLHGNGYSISAVYRNFLFYEVFLNGPIPNAVTDGHHATALKTPVYPFFLWAVFASFGSRNFLALFLLQILIAGFTAVLMYVALASLSRLAAVTAGCGFALYPPFIYHVVTSPESTVLILFWIACTMWLAVKISQKATNGRWAGLGILGSAMTLTDPASLPFFLLLVLYMGFVYWRKNRMVRPVGLTLLLLILPLAPWCVRNTLTFNRFVLLKTPVWQNFARGLQTDNIDLPREELLILEKKGRSLNEAEEDQQMKRLVRQEFTEVPGKILWAFPHNFANFWWETSRYSDNRSWSYLLGRRVPYAGLLIVGFIAIAASLCDLIRRPLWFLENRIIASFCLSLILSYTAVFTVFGAWNLRYHFPSELALIIIGSSLLVCNREPNVVSGKDFNKQFTAA